MFLICFYFRDSIYTHKIYRYSSSYEINLKSLFQAEIVFNLFSILCMFSGWCSYKVVLIKKECTVRWISAINSNFSSPGIPAAGSNDG